MDETLRKINCFETCLEQITPKKRASNWMVATHNSEIAHSGEASTPRDRREGSILSDPELLFPLPVRPAGHSEPYHVPLYPCPKPVMKNNLGMWLPCTIQKKFICPQTLKYKPSDYTWNGEKYFLYKLKVLQTSPQRKECQKYCCPQIMIRAHREWNCYTEFSGYWKVTSIPVWLQVSILLLKVPPQQTAVTMEKVGPRTSYVCKLYIHSGSLKRQVSR